MRALQQDLTERLGAKVLIQQGSGGKGKLVVSYNSLDELDGILAHIQLTIAAYALTLNGPGAVRILRALFKATG